jgi:hypothetical protein
MIGKRNAKGTPRRRKSRPKKPDTFRPKPKGSWESNVEELSYRRLALLATVAVCAVIFRACINFLSDRIRSASMVEREIMTHKLVQVYYRPVSTKLPLDFGGVGIVIAPNMVLTSARAAGWKGIGSVWYYVDGGRRKGIWAPDLDYDLIGKPVQWIVRSPERELSAYPVWVMPKGYGVALLRVDGLMASGYPRIADTRPRGLIQVREVFFVPRRYGGVVENEKAHYLRVEQPEVAFVRSFPYGWNRIETPVKVILASAPPRRTELFASDIQSGAPVYDQNGELCGVVLSSSVYKEPPHGFYPEQEQSYVWIEPLNEVKDVIEASLK